MIFVERVRVQLGSESYDINIGEGLLSAVGPVLLEIGFSRRVVVVTNPTVAGIFAGPVLASLREAKFQVDIVQVADGEEFKTVATLTSVYDELIRLGLDRHSGILALGGGVIGDLAGFAAATFLRGIPFVQVPTTLLAQVDSSVGGKTGVNHPLGKNLIGSFYQPKHVLIDVAALDSLPEREFAAGLAEVVKYGIIRDRGFFDWLRDNRQLLAARDHHALIYAVMKSCQIKADVVELDEKEESLRAILNYGHTFGHAVETLAGYGNFRHGEAVAIGMVVAAALSVELGYSTAAELDEIRSLLQAFGLPITPPHFPLNDYLVAMGRDKKVKQGELRYVLNRGIGDCFVTGLADPQKLLASVLVRLTAAEG